MFIDDYVESLRQTIQKFIPIISVQEISIDIRSSSTGKIKGAISFIDGSILYFIEVIKIDGEVRKLKYSYHYQIKNGNLVFRHDNAPHYKNVKTFPHHKHFHSDDNVLISSVPIFKNILSEIEDYVMSKLTK